ncbi:phage tail protein [Kitasatospora purpeofusca]|uniref:phage tail protein n=1 Tax=Kitasatospora purpeofusca TaxID=67352 RepID=UPI00364D9D93
MSTPTYRYKLTVDGRDYLFCGISGLEVAYDLVEYKDGTGGWHQMPGYRNPLVLALRQGSTEGYKALCDWIDTININSVEKKDVTVALLDESLTPSVTWSVIDAFPIKITSLVYADGIDQPVIGELVLQAARALPQFQD